MKIKIYVNTNEYSANDQFPRVLTEKQYQEKIEELVKERMEYLKYDNGFMDALACDYNISEVFFMSEKQKQKIIEEFKPYAINSAKNEMEDYYKEHEIEI